MKVNDRTGEKLSNCPLCSSKRIVEGVNDIFTTNPELKRELDYEKNSIDPYEVATKSNKKYWWKCSKCGYECVVASRTKRNSRCPICRKKKFI